MTLKGYRKREKSSVNESYKEETSSHIENQEEDEVASQNGVEADESLKT